MGKNQQTVGLKLHIFRMHYIAIYFSDISFPNKELVITEAFAFSRFKKQTHKLS